MYTNTIVFITSALSQPRVIKRITSFYEAGYKVRVYGYHRGMYTCNEFPSDIPVCIIGEQKDGKNYFSKFVQFYRDVNNIVRQEGLAAIYYSFSMIITILLNLKNVRYAYEISDILYGYNKFKIIQNIAKAVDKKIIKDSLVTVVTSAGFANYLIGRNREKFDNIIVQPNKLSTSFRNTVRKVKDPNISGLVFSFVGAIRYPNTILRFAKIIGQYFPQHEFHFYGESSLIGNFVSATKQYSNVKFFGAYRNPEDLEKIYSKVDILVACYEADNLNERIAEPNKLYEAMFFCKPIIVSQNTFVEEQVEMMQCGWSINAYDDEAIVTFISNLTNNEITKIISKEQLINANDLIDNPNDILSKFHHLEYEK